MKKIAITGHTSGIGLEIYQSLSNKFNIIGLSRSNGYDLSTLSGISKAVYTAKDCDVFINNAYGGADTQVKIAELWSSVVTDRPRLIINITSNLIKLRHLIPAKTTELLEYIDAKQQLVSTSHNINSAKNTCRAVNLGLGWIDTEFNKKHGLDHPLLIQSYQQLKNKNKLISVAEVANVVEFILKQHDHSFISELTLENWDLC